MKTATLTEVLIIFIVQNFYKFCNGNNTQEFVKKIRHVDIIYDLHSTFINDVEYYLRYSVTVLENAGRDIVNGLTRFISDIFFDGKENFHDN